MNGTLLRSTCSKQAFRSIVTVLCIALLVPGDTMALQTPPPQDAPGANENVKIPNDQLDSLVAPVALYPDPLLSQTLVASTYPLEVIQLHQWLSQDKKLKDQALAEAVQKQDWDPSIQAMATFPDVVKQLAENIKWTTDLGNAFLAQQSDVLDAVQRMRVKAQGKGSLKSTEQQVVETRVVENKSVVVIEQAQPQVVYVPSYNPVEVWGSPPYPYPPVAYPSPGYYAAGMAISFGVGVALGAAWGGGWGWNCGWGGNNNININRNNNYVNHYNRQNANRVTNAPGGGGNTWQHNPQHRGGAPYGDRSTAKQFGGTARGDSLANRQAAARQNQGQFGNRQGGVDRGGLAGRQEASGLNRGSMADRGGARSDFNNRGAGEGGSNRGSGDRIGNQRVSGGGDRGGRTAFGGGGGGGGGGGFSGSSARASSSRGASSMGARGGGGRRR